MNRSDLIKVFTERFNLPDTEATVFVNAFFDRIRQALIEGTEWRSVASAPSR